MKAGVWLLLTLAWTALADEPPKLVQDFPYRTDASNQDLPWYQITPGVFPPKGSEHWVVGELVEADFIHRSGQFRTAGTGQLVDFTLLPYAEVMSLNAEADLRDIPLGTSCRFALYQDNHGTFTKVAALLDGFTQLASEGQVYQLNRADLGTGKLDVERRRSTGGQDSLGPSQLAIDEKTRIWKGSKKGKPDDLVSGDELLVNFTGDDSRGTARCDDIWVGAESQKLATEHQRRKHQAFLRERGLAVRIDRVEGKKLTVSFFGHPDDLKALCERDGIDLARWAQEHRSVDAVVANEELRTYNPPVDRKQARVLAFEAIPTESWGSAGARWIIEPDLLLEGFRKGRIIRLFVHHSWPINDMPFGECLYTEAPQIRAITEEAIQYPFRTDFANEDLPWYRLKPGELPPFRSHHLILGELVEVGADGRSGRFRRDRSEESVEFRMPPFGIAFRVNAEANLGDIPLGTRCHLFMHQDDRGAFTIASMITDDFTSLASEDLNYRLDAVEPGKLFLAKRNGLIKNDKEDMIQPPDLGRAIFGLNSSTRFWKGEQQIALKDLLVGDEILVNLGGATSTNRGACTDVWVGRAEYKLASEAQRARHEADLKANGLPAWIEKVEGKTLSITFFSGSRKSFLSLLNTDVQGDEVQVILADEQLRPVGEPPTRFRLRDQRREDQNGGSFGSSGIWWRIEADRDGPSFQPGQIIRVYRQGWPIPKLPAPVRGG